MKCQSEVWRIHARKICWFWNIGFLFHIICIYQFISFHIISYHLISFQNLSSHFPIRYDLSPHLHPRSFFSWNLNLVLSGVKGGNIYLQTRKFLGFQPLVFPRIHQFLGFQTTNFWGWNLPRFDAAGDLVAIHHGWSWLAGCLWCLGTYWSSVAGWGETMVGDPPKTGKGWKDWWKRFLGRIVGFVGLYSGILGKRTSWILFFLSF